MKTGDFCPRCQVGEIERIARHPWMRRIPKSKYYLCLHCRERYLAIGGWPIRLPWAKKARHQAD